MAHQGVGGAQQVHEVGGDLGIVAELIVDETQVVAHRPDGGCAHARDVVAVRHDHEHFHDGRRSHLEDVVATRLDVVVVDAEAVVDAFDPGPLAGAQDGLVEVLEKDVVDLPEQQHMAVVVVHELFDTELRVGVAIPEAPCQLPLVVEQQSVLLAFGDEVQPESDAPQKPAALGQPAGLQIIEEAGLHQLVEVLGVVIVLGDPEDGLDVAQSARRTLEVGFEVVVDMVVLAMPLDLFVLLGPEEALARPHGLARQDLVELGRQEV